MTILYVQHDYAVLALVKHAMKPLPWRRNGLKMKMANKAARLIMQKVYWLLHPKRDK